MKINAKNPIVSKAGIRWMKVSGFDGFTTLVSGLDWVGPGLKGTCSG